MNTLTRILMTTLVVTTILGAAPARVDAQTAPTMDRLTVRMLQKRDALAPEFVRQWLRVSEKTRMGEMLTEMIRLELPLANKPGIPLYTTAIKDQHDIGKACSQVAHAILKHHGFDLNSAQLFVDREFPVYAEAGEGEDIAPVNLVPAQR